MNYRILFAAGAALALAACGQQQKSQTQANALMVQAAETYSDKGKITAIAGDQVSIAHGPIAGIGLPAVTMTFTAPPDIAPGAQVGSDVSFAFQKQASAYVLTSLQKR